MSEEPEAPGTDPTLDEDLFDFDEASFDVSSEDDYDLDEIFAAFEAADGDEVWTADPAPSDLAPEPVAASAPPEPATPEPLPATNVAPTEPAPEAPAPAQAPAPASVAPAAPVAAKAPEPVAADQVAPAAAAPVASTPVTAATAAPRDGASVSLNRGILWILVALVSLNATVALVVVKSTGEMRHSFQSVGDDMQGAARELVDGAARMRNDAIRDFVPVTSFDAENHGTFDAAQEEIENGEYARARRRLYSLLAIVDRLDPDVREEVEGRANYLLAHARHLEALEKLEEKR